MKRKELALRGEAFQCAFRWSFFADKIMKNSEGSVGIVISCLDSISYRVSTLSIELYYSIPTTIRVTLNIFVSIRLLI